MRASPRRAIPLVGSLVGSALILTAFASAVAAGGALVTRGELEPFAAGAGFAVSGHATMVRTADGRTIVTVHAEGLLPDTAYASHVHRQACADGDADGHYKLDPAGPAAPPNEIWPGFATNAAGIGNGLAVVGWTAGPSAISVVVHAPGGAKIACADLR